MMQTVDPLTNAEVGQDLKHCIWIGRVRWRLGKQVLPTGCATLASAV